HEDRAFGELLGVGGRALGLAAVILVGDLDLLAVDASGVVDALEVRLVRLVGRRVRGRRRARDGGAHPDAVLGEGRRRYRPDDEQRCQHCESKPSHLVLRLERKARCHLGSDPAFLVARVHRFHQGAVALGHDPSLHLSRRRHGLALELGIELARQQAKGLHLLDARELVVRAPTSPVASLPWRYSVRVASGSRQYPPKNSAAVTRISPSPSSSTAMFGATTPTSPGGGYGPRWPDTSAPPVSVWPYASQRLT